MISHKEMMEIIATEAVESFVPQLRSERSLCTSENPMPKGATGWWAHTKAKEIHDWGDGTVEMKCESCGLEWTQELPQ